MRFAVLGTVTVVDDGVRVPVASPKQRVLLSVLLSRPGAPVCDDVLIDALWGENAPATARDTLRWHAHHLRRLLGDPDRLARASGGYALRVEPGELDADVFASRYREGVAARRDGDETRAAELLASALELWRGDAYGDLADARALRTSAAGLEELRLSAIEALNAAELALGRHHAVATRLSWLPASGPLRESLWAQLLIATYRSGRTTDALAAYATARARCRDELGADPSPELRELHRLILRHDPSLMEDACPVGGVDAPEPLWETARLADLGGFLHRLCTALLDHTRQLKGLTATAWSGPEYGYEPGFPAAPSSTAVETAVHTGPPVLRRLSDAVEQLGRLARDIPVPFPAAAREPVPAWLAERLIGTARMAPEEVAALDLRQAVDVWTAFKTKEGLSDAASPAIPRPLPACSAHGAVRPTRHGHRRSAARRGGPRLRRRTGSSREETPPSRPSSATRGSRSCGTPRPTFGI